MDPNEFIRRLNAIDPSVDDCTVVEKLYALTDYGEALENPKDVFPVDSRPCYFGRWSAAQSAHAADGKPAAELDRNFAVPPVTAPGRVTAGCRIDRTGLLRSLHCNRLPRTPGRERRAG